MLQSNHDGMEIQMAVFNPPSGNSAELDSRPLDAPCATTKKFIELFADTTGWKIEFAESNSSLQRRKIDGTGAPAQGTFAIVDMDAEWPAQIPTVHRGRCDQLVELVDDLVEQLQTTRLDLTKAQSALAGFDPNANVDEVNLVDSFVPKFGRRSTDRINFGEREYDDCETFTLETPRHDECETDFVLCQPAPETIAPVSPPFEGWAFGGVTGIVGNLFLDWMVDSEERISILSGEIESESGKSFESRILVDPLTQEFQIQAADSLRRSSDPASPIPAFYLWDSDVSALTPIAGDSVWTQLKSGQAIVATTASKLSEMQCWKDLDQGQTTAEDLAAMLRSAISSSEPLLVLKRV